MSSSDYDLYRYTAPNERVEELIQECRKKRMKTELEKERKREQVFKNYYEKEKDIEESIFNFPGLNFLEFNHKKIKFRFIPSKIVENVRKNDKFYCSLWYKFHKWSVKRNSLPVDCKLLICNLFESTTDIKILGVINSIYDILVKWAKHYKKVLENRYKRYLDGDEDIVLDSTEEELFLNQEEIEEIHRKRKIILKRMIPPNV